MNKKENRKRIKRLFKINHNPTSYSVTPMPEDVARMKLRRKIELYKDAIELGNELGEVWDA